MAACTIQKSCRDGIGWSAVELGDVRHLFATAIPRRGATLAEEARDALETIAGAVCDEGDRRSIVHQAVFVADPSRIDECRRIIHDFYGSDLPATTYIPQPPCDGRLLAIEALGVGRGRGEVEIERISPQLVIARHNGIAWIHCAQIVPPMCAAGVYEGTISAFTQMRSLLAGADAQFHQVIRTWLYLGGIVEDEGGTQRYRELNRARSDFYRGIPFLADRLPADFPGMAYPASTGIGTEGRKLMLSAIALATDRRDIVAVPLENPRQTAAFDYPGHYSPQSPKFSRAVALSCGDYATIFISGTASVTASETQHVGDAAAQTHATLDNIAALIGEENLSRHGLPGLGTSLDGLGLVRVYVKRPADFARTRAVCRQRLGELPVVYAMADVCRSDLLVEIEGIAFSRKEPSPAGPGVPHFTGEFAAK